MINEEQLKNLEKFNINKDKIIEKDNRIYPYAYIDMDGLFILDLFQIDE